MHKSIVIFKNIKDLASFEEYIMERAIPYILNMEGTMNIQLTSLQAVNSPEPQQSNEDQFLIEVYFERIENVEVLIQEKEGIEFLNELATHPNFEVSMFMGDETNLRPKLHKKSDDSIQKKN